MTGLGRTRDVLTDLKRHQINATVFSDIEPDPSVPLVEKVGRIFSDEQCQGIIALGGGSTMDLAKAAAVRVSQSGVLTEYESIVGGSGKIRPPLPPVICVPTTSGTGSEVNPYAVISDTSRDIKFMILSDHIIPRLAVIDPEICQTMPPFLTVESGIDALAHCIEGYVGLVHPYHPFYESLALYGVKLIGRSLRNAYRNGADIEARQDMCIAAMYGGLAFSKGLGIGHAITHVLGAHHHVAHGRAATMGLICFVRGNRSASRTAFSELAWALDRSDDLETALRRLYQDLEVSTRFQDLGVTKEDLRSIAFYASRDAVNMATNPTPITRDQLYRILLDVYD